MRDELNCAYCDVMDVVQRLKDAEPHTALELNMRDSAVYELEKCAAALLRKIQMY